MREAATHKQMFEKAEARMKEFKQMYEALEATHNEVSKALAEMTKKVSEVQKQEEAIQTMRPNPPSRKCKNKSIA